MMIKNKRPQMLLEVLIALAIVSLCMIPLLSPNVTIIQSQMRFVERLEIDHLTNLLFADIVHDLYENEFDWSSIRQGRVFEIQEDDLKRYNIRENLSFEGSYRFSVRRQKPRPEEEFTLYLFNLDFEYSPKNPREVDGKILDQPINYHFELFVIRDLTVEPIKTEEIEQKRIRPS